MDLMPCSNCGDRLALVDRLVEHLQECPLCEIDSLCIVGHELKKMALGMMLSATEQASDENIV